MKQYIAIDIGGSKIKYGRISAAGKILYQDEIVTPVSFDKEEIGEKIFWMIETQMNTDVCGIGVATLGGVDEKTGKVIGVCGNFILLKELSIKEILEAKYRLPVYVMNDVNAAAIGEAWIGEGKKLDYFYCITLGTGIGGAMVINGKVYKGANGYAGEVGLLWKYKGQNCYEEIASAKAFDIQSQKIKKNEGWMLQKALDGDADLQKLLNDWLDNVAKGIVDIIYMMDPGTIIVGGGVSKMGKALTDKIEERVNEIIDSEFAGKTKIIPSKHGNTSNLIGAVYPLINNSESKYNRIK